MVSFRNNHKEFIESNKLISKSQLKFRCDKHNVYTEEISKIASSTIDE